MNEITVLDLDWDLIQHLAKPESFTKLQGEQFSEALINDPLAKRVWVFQTEHAREHGAPASPSVLENQFEEVSIQEPQAAIGDLVERLRLRYVRNQGLQAVEEIAQLTVKEPMVVAKKMINEGRRLHHLTEARGESFSESDHELTMQEYDQRAIKGKGPSLGFSELDEHFHGQEGLTFLVAGPKNYKSWFTVNAVMSNIRYGGFPYLYSLELPARDTTWRLKCMVANIPYWKYLRTSLELEDRQLLKDTSERLAEMGNYRIEMPKPGERGVSQLVEKAINSEATCVFVDQLQYVETKRGSSLGSLNDTGAYFEVLDDFRNYSDEIPIFIVHQFNRSVMNSDGMPEPQQGKGSAAIEETATLELGLWANKDMRQSNVIQMGTLISRHYSQAKWEFGVELTRGCNLILNGPAE